MWKAALVAAVIAVPLLVANSSAPIRAQSAPASCTAESLSAPSPGHYTGTWHSTADYQFAVFGTTLDLQVTIDGTLDLTVTPDGHVSGTASGNVNAPITDYGRQDMSSGYGTISGAISGVVSGAGSTLTLGAPVIDMHWGTFGGHAVEEHITMPDYQLPVSGFDCISATGTISEQNFPTMNVVADGTGQVPEQVPGIGTAGGSWQVTSDDATTFHDLTGQIDAFTNGADTLLNGPSSSVTPAAINSDLVQPFQALQGAIAQHPNLTACLMTRLDQWAAGAMTRLNSSILTLSANHDLAAQRSVTLLLRFAALLGTAGCVTTNSAVATQASSAMAQLLYNAVLSQDWAQAALDAREVLLASGKPQPIVTGAMSALAGQTLAPAAALDAARVAYVFGDTTDAARLAARVSIAPAKPKPHAKKSGHKHPAPRKPAPVTPKPPLDTTLQTGIPRITDTLGSGGNPAISWQPVPGASGYLVTVRSASGDLLFAWAGTATSVSYGDSTLPTVPGTDQPWPLPLPSGTISVSILAIGPSGAIDGIAYS